MWAFNVFKETISGHYLPIFLWVGEDFATTPKIDVKTASREVKLTFIHYFGSNWNEFYLYMVTSAVGSSTPCNSYAWLYKGCGYH